MRFKTLSSSAIVLGMLFLPVAAPAQEQAPSLGDLARNLRKDKDKDRDKDKNSDSGNPTDFLQVEPRRPSDSPSVVIDNDNLAQAMEDAKNARPVKADKTVFSIDPSGNNVKVSSPDVTCNLSFNAKAGSLLIKPVLIEDVPLAELLKIDGPGSIQDESLQLEVFNGTDWDLREITIGLTLERKPGENAEVAARARVIPAAQGLSPVTVERRSDVTLLYHLKAEAKPFSTTSFHEDIGIMPGADEDWRWSIVEAKGVRPQSQVAPESLKEPLFGAPEVVPESNESQFVHGPATPNQPATAGNSSLDPSNTLSTPPR